MPMIRLTVAGSRVATQSQRRLPPSVRTSNARWPMAKPAPMPMMPSSYSWKAFMWLCCSAGSVVQVCPRGGTYCRSSSQIAHSAGGCARSGYCVPQAVQMYKGITELPRHSGTRTRCASLPFMGIVWGRVSFASVEGSVLGAPQRQHVVRLEAAGQNVLFRNIAVVAAAGQFMDEARQHAFQLLADIRLNGRAHAFAAFNQLLANRSHDFARLKHRIAARLLIRAIEFCPHVSRSFRPPAAKLCAAGIAPPVIRSLTAPQRSFDGAVPLLCQPEVCAAGALGMGAGARLRRLYIDVHRPDKRPYPVGCRKFRQLIDLVAGIVYRLHGEADERRRIVRNRVVLGGLIGAHFALALPIKLMEAKQ